jgi:hypothetical protein
MDAARVCDAKKMNITIALTAAPRDLEFTILILICISFYRHLVYMFPVTGATVKSTVSIQD